MASAQEEQFTFQCGEVHPDYVWRPDLALRKKSLKTALNVRPRLSGAAESRPGMTRIAAAAGDGWIVDMIVESTVYFLVFTAAQVAIYRKSDRALVTTLTTAPWTADMVLGLDFDTHGRKCWVFHQDMPTQLIELPDGGTWTRTAMAFPVGIGDAIRQPYYRFAPKGVTLQPSDSTEGASITIETSEDYFDADMVGLRFRLQGREVVTTAWTDARHMTATVVQKLFETWSVPVEDSSGFEVGEIVEGKDSTAKGEVVDIPDGTHLVLLMLNFSEFLYKPAAGDDPEVKELLVSPNATTHITGATSQETDAPVLDWTEQAISAFRGYPGTGAVHANRLWLGRLPEVPFGILASVIGGLDDFEAAPDDNAAIFEEIGSPDIGEIMHIVSGEQLLVMTRRKLLYYPESESNPIRPTGFQLLEVGPDGANSAPPINTSEGVLYAAANGGALLGAFPTGDVRHSWRTSNLSDLAAHLIALPRSIAYVDAVRGEAERYAYVANANGELAVLTYSSTDADTPPGWAPWVTNGSFRSLAAADGECWALVRRTIAGVTAYQIEVIEADRLVDGAIDLPAQASNPATTETIDTPSGPMAAELLWRYAPYASTTVSLLIDGAYIGEVALDADGDFGAPDINGSIELGFMYATECVPWPPMPADDQRARRRPRRITRAHVRYRGRYMTVDGTMRAAFEAGEDTRHTPPERDELYTAAVFSGWSQEPTVTIAKPYPAPWQLLGLSLEVTS